MAVHVTIAVTGLDEAAYDQMVPALHPVLKQQPGFVIHYGYATPGGFAVGEVWDTKEQHETWFNANVAPNLPSGDAVSIEYIDLHAVLQP